MCFSVDLCAGLWTWFAGMLWNVSIELLCSSGLSLGTDSGISLPPPDQLCCFGIMIKLPPLRSWLVFWDPLGWTDWDWYCTVMVMLGLFSVTSLLFCLCNLLLDACVGCFGSWYHPYYWYSPVPACSLDDLVCSLLLPVESLLWPKLVSLLFMGPCWLWFKDLVVKLIWA
jgi:hypothetical protein